MSFEVSEQAVSGVKQICGFASVRNHVALEAKTLEQFGLSFGPGSGHLNKCVFANSVDYHGLLLSLHFRKLLLPFDFDFLHLLLELKLSFILQLQQF